MLGHVEGDGECGAGGLLEIVGYPKVAQEKVVCCVPTGTHPWRSISAGTCGIDLSQHLAKCSLFLNDSKGTCDTRYWLCTPTYREMTDLTLKYF